MFCVVQYRTEFDFKAIPCRSCVNVPDVSTIITCVVMCMLPTVVFGQILSNSVA